VERHLDLVLELVTTWDVPPTPSISIFKLKKVGWNSRLLFCSEWRTDEFSILNIDLKVIIRVKGADHFEDSFGAVEVGCGIFKNWFDPELDCILWGPITHIWRVESEVRLIVLQFQLIISIVASDSIKLFAVIFVRNSLGRIQTVVRVLIWNLDESRFN